MRERVERLTAGHRRVESAWQALEPGLKAISQGREPQANAAARVGLVDEYLAHARFEEQQFLPLGQQILGRNGKHMGALGLALHARHVLPELLQGLGLRI